MTPAGRALPPLRCDPDAPLVAEVVRTTNDAYVGRVSLVRVFSGTMRPDSVVHVSGHLAGFAGHDVEGHGDHDEDERIGLLSSPLGDALRPKPEAIAGDLCVVAKLSRAETTDTLSSKDSPAVVEPWVLPDPLLPVAIHAVTKSDEDKLAGALQRLVAEDPTMRLEHNAETHQVVLWTMGQAHVDVLLERLRERYAVTVEPEPLRVPLREAFVASCHRPRPPRQAERRPRPVRRVRPHRGAPAAWRGLRVRRQGRRWLGAAAVHPQRGEGGAGPARAGLPRRLPHGRPQGDVDRWEGPLGRQQRHGVPDRRRPGPARRHLADDRHPARAGGRGARWWSTTTTSAR